VKEFGGDALIRAVLDELVRVGAVELQVGGGTGGTGQFVRAGTPRRIVSGDPGDEAASWHRSTWRD
jgi:hypothetical protein